MKRFFTLLRREIWEHRSLWLVPAIVCALMIGGTALFGNFEVHSDQAITAAQRGAIVGALTTAFVGFVFLVLGAVLFFYLLDSLYAERKDRSILFWKSMPVSDAETVLAKFTMALVVVPVAVLLATLCTDAIVRTILLLRQGSESVDAAFPLWDGAIWLKTQALLAYLLGVSMLWYAPVAAYLLLCSAAARRSAALFAVLPPMVLILLERMFASSNEIAGFFANRLAAPFPIALGVVPGEHLSIVIDRKRVTSAVDLFDRIDPSHLLTTADLWLGVVAAAALLWGAILLRRFQNVS